MDTFDDVIVGAGSAGCFLAARLAEQNRHSVCLIEAGPKDWHPMIHVPVGWMKLMKTPQFNWMYDAELSVWTSARRIPVHMIATCRMGPRDRANPVVDQHLKLHGISNLPVCDASIMPTIPAANTNAAAMMIGEMLATFLA